MCRSDSTYSRSLGPGGAHWVEKRLSIWPFTCVPSPSRNLPLERSCKSRLVWATTIGDLGKAMATLVSSVTLDVLVAAKIRGINGSLEVSLLDTPSYPIDSAHEASEATAFKSWEWRRYITLMLSSGI
jgi:hypothetical protein